MSQQPEHATRSVSEEIPVGGEGRTSAVERNSDGPPLACPACQRLVAERHARFCAACGHRFASPSFERIEERLPAADPLVGRILADRYRIEEVIGRGGMGVVYRIEHTRIGKAMAMKLLHGDLARDREVVRRFRREAETVSKLDHLNTVQIFDFGQSEGLTYLIMELLSGEDLGSILQKEGTISFSRAAHLAAQVCGSVQQAHDRGIVHRDLKPENIRVLHDRSTPDFVKVLDFGLAKLREGTELGGASITRQGLLVGTPYYMAPEQIRGERADHRADVYAMGCVLYKAIVGVPPFWASSPVGVLTKHITDEVVPPRQRSPRRDLRPEVDQIVLRAMTKDPAQRYGSMRELRDDLERYLDQHPAQPIAVARRATEEAESPSGQALTQPMIAPAVTNRRPTVRPVVAATRDEVERFERRIRAQSLAQRATIGLLVLAAGAGGYYAWQQRPIAPIAPPTTEQEPNDVPAQASLLPEGASLAAQLGRRIDASHGDVDLFAFDVPAGVDTIALRVSELPNIDLAVDLFVSGRADPVVVLDTLPLGGAEAAPNLPVEPGRYLARVYEVRVAGRHPIENVSDDYSITWNRIARADGDEHEWNDGLSQAETLPDGPSTRRGYLGWNGDVDTYCIAAIRQALDVSVGGVESLDFVLETIVEGRETRTDNAPRGASEHTRVPAAAQERRVCVRVTSAAGVQRGDASSPYTLELRTEANGDAP